MKKIYLLAIAALVTTAAFSQVKWGVQATGNLSTASLNEEYSEMFKKTPAIGFGAGVVSEATLSEKLSLRSSLNLLQKGVKMKATIEIGEGDDAFSTEATAVNKLYYAELPVNLIYNVSMSGGRLFFGAGPSVGYGLFGKSKITSTNLFDPTEKETQEADAFKKEEDGGAGFKRFDLSANAVAGFQWNSGLTVNVGYLHGFSNLIDGADGESYKNRGLQLTVGYMFGKKK